MNQHLADKIRKEIDETEDDVDDLDFECNEWVIHEMESRLHDLEHDFEMLLESLTETEAEQHSSFINQTILLKARYKTGKPGKIADYWQ